MPRLAVSWGAACLIAILSACSNDDALIKTTAGYPPVDMKPSDLPSFAVGDSFTFDNPAETWTVIGIRDGLVEWRSSLGGTRKTVFAPFVPPIEWTAPDRSAGEERLTAWGDGLFPLTGGKKTEFRTRARRTGDAAPAPYEWKCYSGSPRKVTVEAGAYAAYPVFCRRNDGLTVQSFYAPEVNAPLTITRRKRPAPAEKRELVAFELAKGPRIAATDLRGLPKGIALAAVDPSARPPAPAGTAVAEAPAGATPAAAPPPQIAGASAPRTTAGPETSAPTPSAPQPEAPRVLTAPPTRAPPPVVATTPAPPRTAAAPSEPAPPPVVATPAVPPPAARPTPPPSALAAREAAPSAGSVPTIAPPPRIAAPAPEKPATVALARPADAPAPATTKRPDLSKGSYGVQIASYRNPENVGPGWEKLRQRHGPLLDGVSHLVRPVELGAGKGVFHRLIAGPFPARGGAEQLCRSIRARGASCIVQVLDG